MKRRETVAGVSGLDGRRREAGFGGMDSKRRETAAGVGGTDVSASKQITANVDANHAKLLEFASQAEADDAADLRLIAQKLVALNAKRVGVHDALEVANIETGRLRVQIKLGPSQFEKSHATAIEHERTNVQDTIQNLGVQAAEYDAIKAQKEREEIEHHENTADLQRRIAECKAAFEDGVASLNNTLSHRTDCYLALTAEQEHLAALDSDIQELRGRVDVLVARIAEEKHVAEAARARIEAETQDLDAQTVALQQEHERQDGDLWRLLTSLREKVATLQAENAELEKIAPPILDTALQCEASEAAIIAECKTLQKETEELLDVASKRAAGLATKEKEHSITIKDLVDTILHCSKARQKSVDSLEKEKQRGRDIAREVSKMADQVKTQGKVIEGLVARAAEAQAEMDVKNSEVTKALQESITWENDLMVLENDHQAVMMAQKQIVDVCTRKRQEEERARILSEKELAQLKATTEKETKEFHESLADLKKRAEDTRLLIAQEKASIAVLESTVAQRSSGIQTLQETLPKKHAERKGIDQLHKEQRKGLVDKHAMLTTQVAQLTKESHALYIPIAELKERHKAEEAHLEEGKERVAKLTQVWVSKEDTINMLKHTLAREEAVHAREKQRFLDTKAKDAALEQAQRDETREWQVRRTAIALRKTDVEGRDMRLTGAIDKTAADIARLRKRTQELKNALPQMQARRDQDDTRRALICKGLLQADDPDKSAGKRAQSADMQAAATHKLVQKGVAGILARAEDCLQNLQDISALFAGADL